MGDELIPRKDLNKQLVKGVAGVGAGIGLFSLAAIHNPVAAIIVGGVVTVVGLGISRSKKDRLAGMLGIGAGALTLLSIIPGIGPVAGWLLGIGGLGLLVAGGFSLYRFFKNMKKRS